MLQPVRTCPAGRAASTAGFTLIEFMIAMTLSLMVLAALTAAFVANSRSRTEIERANEQIENGRFALQIMTDDLEMAGFYSHLNLDIAMTAETPMPVPGAIPRPCPLVADFANVAAWLAALREALPMHMQGYDSLAAADLVAAQLDDCPGLDDFKPGTDIVVLRRTATTSCVPGTANCPPIAGAAYFQASLCSGPTELDSTEASAYFRLDTSTANLDRTQRDCATPAELRQYLIHVYFIANNDQAGDGIPTLKRAELGNTAATATGFTVAPLARGIENLQLEYGVDTTGDGAPDEFTSAPGTVARWRDVMGVRLSVLARNTAPSRDHVDVKTYTLAGTNFGPFNDGYKRHVYQTSVRLNNPAGRREQ